jgi:hypothetical protein
MAPRPPYYVPDDRPSNGIWRVYHRLGRPVPVPNRFSTRDAARARAKELNQLSPVKG